MSDLHLSYIALPQPTEDGVQRFAGVQNCNVCNRNLKSEKAYYLPCSYYLLLSVTTLLFCYCKHCQCSLIVDSLGAGYIASTVASFRIRKPSVFGARRVLVGAAC